MVEILESTLKDKESHKRVDFATYLSIVKRAMNLRTNENSARLVFDLFDTDKKGIIHAHKIYKTSQQIGMHLKMDEIKSIINNCGSRRANVISFDNFMEVLRKHQ